MKRFYLCLKGQGAPESHDFHMQWRQKFPEDTVEDITWCSMEGYHDCNVLLSLEHDGDMEDALQKMVQVLGVNEGHFERKVVPVPESNLRNEVVVPKELLQSTFGPTSA